MEENCVYRKKGNIKILTITLGFGIVMFLLLHVVHYFFLISTGSKSPNMQNPLWDFLLLLLFTLSRIF